MEHDREDSMDDMIGGVPPSINVGQMNARFHFSKMSNSYNNTLLENDQNLLEGMMLSNNNNNNNTVATLSSQLGGSASTSNASASKRTLSSLYWNDHEDVAASNKRFNLESDHHHGSVVRNDQESGTVATSFASLLNNLPQTPNSLHQQTMLGSIGDGLLRTTPYQIQGMNWYG